MSDVMHTGRMTPHGDLDAALTAALAAEIRSRRAYLDLTQEQVWTKAGISEASYKKIENGKPGVSRSIDQISRIAGALDVRTSELVERVETAARKAVERADLAADPFEGQPFPADYDLAASDDEVSK